MIFMSIACTLMASFPMFSTVCKTQEKSYIYFHSKEVLRRHFQLQTPVIGPLAADAVMLSLVS